MPPGFPDALFGSGHVNRWIKQNRNLLADVSWPGSGENVILKKYQPRGVFSSLRLMQGLPRAIRHWNNAWLLKNRGINTPHPLLIAMPEFGRGQGLVATACIRNFVHVRDVFGRESDATGTVELHGLSMEVADFACICGQYVRQLHDLGIVHRDLSGANILVPSTWDSSIHNLAAEFCLVDVNRVRDVAREELTAQLRFQDLERLMVPDHCLDQYFAGYAGDSEEIKRERPRFDRYRNAYRRMRSARNPLYRAALKTFTYWPRTG